MAQDIRRGTQIAFDTLKDARIRPSQAAIKPLTGHPFFVTNEVQVPSHTKLHSLVIGGLCAAALVIIIQRYASVGDNPQPGLELCRSLQTGAYPDFLSIPVNARESSNPITRELAPIREQELQFYQQAYQWAPQPGLLNGVPSSLFGGFGGQAGTLQDNSETLEILYGFSTGAAPAQQEIVGPLTKLAASNPFATTFEDYNVLFEEGGFLQPLNYENGHSATSDEVLGQDQVTMTPHVLKKINTVFGTKFANLGEQELRDVIPDGQTLSSLAASGNLYLADYEFIENIEFGSLFDADLLFGRLDENGVPQPGPYQKYAYPCSAIFSVMDGQLMPVAIWIGDDADLVFTPRDTMVDWTFARMAFTSINKAFHHVIHFTRNHLFAETVLFASRRTMSQAHPVRAYLEHHGYLSAGLNSFIYNLFFTPRGQNATATDPRQLLMFNGTELLEVLTYDFQTYNFESTDPEVEAFRNGVDGIPNNYYLEDSRRINKALDRLTSAFVDNHYPSDNEIRADIELQAWAAETGAPTMGNVRNFPSAIRSKPELASLLTRIAWQSAVYHHAVSGYHGYNLLSHPLDFVATFYAPAPSAKGQLTMQSLLAMMPTIEQSAHKAALLRPFIRFFPPEDSFALSYLSVGLGNRMVPAVAEFTAAMGDMSALVQERVRKHIADGKPGRPYGLDPLLFPFWTWT